jgi:hypothetical protein
MGGIEIQKTYVAIHRTTGQAIEPEYMGWKKEDIEEYLKQHPLPDDENYSKEDLINDLTQSGGALTFSLDLKDETISFLCDLMYWLTYELHFPNKRGKTNTGYRGVSNA